MIKMNDISYKNLLVMGKKLLNEAGIDDFEIDAWLLMEYVFGISKSYFYLKMEEKTDENKVKEYLSFLKKRASHIPLQHLTGCQEFMGFEFEVNKNVLIPRQDTELLVEKALETAAYIKENNKKEKLNILDICTGSGCIAISLCKILEEKGILAEIDAVDISEEALEIAKMNNKNNNTRVNVFRSNLLENITDRNYDLVLSNPPYIESEEIENLMEEVKNHEPQIALDGGRDGLDFYRKIINESKEKFSDFTIIFEIGYNQGESLKDILSENKYKNIEVIKDLQGNDRVVKAEYKK